MLHHDKHQDEYRQILERELKARVDYLNLMYHYSQIVNSPRVVHSFPKSSEQPFYDTLEDKTKIK
jgi:hypothetical protein